MSFDVETAMDVYYGKTITKKAREAFACKAKNDHDSLFGNSTFISELQQKNRALEGEIAILKLALLQAESLKDVKYGEDTEYEENLWKNLVNYTGLAEDKFKAS